MLFVGLCGVGEVVLYVCMVEVEFVYWVFFSSGCSVLIMVLMWFRNGVWLVCVILWKLFWVCVVD